ncbi:uncharacterized protein LOC132543773 [Ylistrum balloti]|uniref:uncharacterized protein LOC132543773 n=1 Tax=Ylistrum balloti TaxID=509963 RepID=UPI002905E185|nr:uncharacterized protein LOC132543773 [Ylistrum balloti]XP_060063279.1 uncharacterized protein LOC132543773 [Ylistrum balloti]XP_060063280.1 uncharacterized protein LOC132543773 [Ylistrum balloti]
MDKLHFLGLSCTSMYTYTLRNINSNNCCRLLKMRSDNLRQFKRYKHLCQLSKTSSVTSDLTKCSNLIHKQTFQNWNSLSMVISSSCLPSSKSAADHYRRISTFSHHFNVNKDDDILKDDLYLKDLLKEIREDFTSYTKSNKPLQSPDNAEQDKIKSLEENNDKITDEEKIQEDISSSENESSSSSDSSDSDGKVGDFESDSNASNKLSQEGHVQANPTAPDGLDIGGFISLDDFEEVEEFPDTFEPEEVPKWKSPIDLKRGVTGVYDIEELVVLLKADNAKDVCVIRMPDHLKLGDYIVIVTAWSYRHMKAITKNVVTTFKLKMNVSDKYPLVSGEDEGEWVAFDLGNILLHIFREEVREKYDLETLWAVGPKFDSKCEEISNTYILEDTDMNWLQEFYKEKEED